MTGWWVVAGVLLAVVIPLVVALLIITIRPVLTMRRRTAELAARAERLGGEPEALDELVRTPLLIRAIDQHLSRYADALGERRERGER